MKLISVALLAGLIPRTAQGDWIDKVVDKTFVRVETLLAGEAEDPCKTAVASMVGEASNDDSVLANVLESLSLTPCRGRFGFFTEDQVEACLAVQSSPEVQAMIDHGLKDPAMVCAWRPFWTQATANTFNGVAIDSCELCQRTTELIEDTLKKQELEVQLIQQGLKILCQYLPEATKCKVIEDRFDDIVEWIKEGFSPKRICKKIKLCAAKRSKKGHKKRHDHALPKPLDVHHIEQRPAVAAASASRNSGELCTICRDNGRIMQQFADSPHGLELYKTGIQSVCRLAPDAVSCKFMTTTFDALANEFRAGSSVDEACAAVKACGYYSTEPTYLGCSFCEYTAGVVTSAIKQGGTATLPTVKQGIAIMCSALPAQAQCNVMDAQFDTLAQLVQQGKTPEATCETIHMCSPRPASSLAVVPFASQDEIACLLCEYTAQVIARVAEYSTDMVPMVKQGMQLLCTQVPEPAFQSECNAVVSVFDKLASLIEDGTGPTVACRNVQLCDAQRLPALPTKALAQLEAKVTAVVHGAAPKEDEIQCLFCEYTAELIAQVSAYSKDLVPLVKEGMELVCGRIQVPQFQDECNAVVAKFDRLADLIEGGAAAHDACRKVQLCEAANVVSKEVAALETRVRAVIAATVPSDVDDQVECVFCEYTAQVIKRVGDYSQDMVPLLKEGLAAMCGQIQVPQFEDECNAVVAKFDAIAAAIEEGATPDAACHKVALCSGRMALLATEMAQLEAKMLAVVDGKTTHAQEDVIQCLVCTYTAQIIVQVGAYSKDMVPLVKEGMEVMCSQIPVPQFQDECNAVIAQFDTLASLIDGGVSAADACAKVQLCERAIQHEATNVEAGQAFVMHQLAVLETKTKSLLGKNDLIGCLLCEYTGEVILQVKSFSPDLIPLLKEGLEVLCARLQGTGIDEQCNAIVTKFDALAELIEDGKPPNVACAKVVLCAAKPMVQPEVAALEARVAQWIAHPETVTTQEGCLFCKYAATSIAAVAHVDKSQLPKLREAIATMYSVLPPAVECDAVNESFEKLVAALDAGASPATACESVGLCGRPRIVVASALLATQ
ncbi:hypothetical protein SPRG_19311 [Saprolegnia parasitica CBS 223.65]|uniref:Saposin B-type domain-containing protein n=1 Tax=Saprolegnia parasitica (strain CBS 223.65) TaxID=695850 RepID=A0A067D3X5_SAPPC|nr:hypothetical protein SPRG_19311 [Saprolegnia parasitica CBS 223.65]KDO33702.1 hypothetical protein SPRG_19311 [Saprolegnia parasitica CBS 223.65]|eukprot:XP_012195723.1 hypothetical protein SPRG_19311 [Saprolegnia parasitica CBS 223.65]